VDKPWRPHISAPIDLHNATPPGFSPEIVVFAAHEGMILATKALKTSINATDGSKPL
jgi:hypothetical protein